jgi:uncharacterized repeat protein (TIGR03803 family)
MQPEHHAMKETEFMRYKGSILCRQSWFLLAALFLLAATSAPQPANAQSYTVVYNFGSSATDGATSNGDLVEDADGNFYGTTIGGGTGFGTIFKIDSSGVESVLYSFSGGTDGTSPYTGVIRDSEGNLYGTTSRGGDATCMCGTIFKLNAGNVLTTLHRFQDVHDGANPWYFGPLISVNGVLYGVTIAGGPNGTGVLYKITKTGTFTVLHRFGRGRSLPRKWRRDAATTAAGTAALHKLSRADGNSG